MNDVLIDTCVLIDCLRGHAPAVAFVSATITPRMPMTHVIVAAELLAGARDRNEQRLIDSFLSGFDLISPTDADALSPLELYRRYHLSDGVDWPDCQIAATALRLGVEVSTQNVKHFEVFAGLRVRRAY